MRGRDVKTNTCSETRWSKILLKKAPVMNPVIPMIVSTEPLLRFGLRHFLRESGMSKCLEAETAEVAMDLIGKLTPGIVLVCADPGQMDVPKIVRHLRRCRRTLPMLIISRERGAEHVRLCLEAGAQAYLTHEDALAELGLACATLLRGGLHLSGAVAKALLSLKGSKRAMTNPPTPEGRALSTREKEIFQLVGYGCGCKEIAGRLGISVKTVETHQLRMKHKLGVERSSELRLLAKAGAPVRH